MEILLILIVVIGFIFYSIGLNQGNESNKYKYIFRIKENDTIWQLSEVYPSFKPKLTIFKVYISLFASNLPQLIHTSSCPRIVLKSLMKAGSAETL